MKIQILSTPRHSKAVVIWQFSTWRPELSSLIIYSVQIHYENDQFTTSLHTRKTILENVGPRVEQSNTTWGQMSKLYSVCHLTPRNPAGQGPACATSDLPNCLFTPRIPALHKPQRPAVRQKRGFQIHFFTHSFIYPGTE